MRKGNRRGRVMYEPNGFEEGPREDPLKGYVSYAAPVEGSKVRIRAESFADHYSQARQFYISQTPVEQAHIRDALVFELGKCELSRIRRAMVGHLRNIEEDLAQGVAAGLGLPELPPPATAATADSAGPSAFARPEYPAKRTTEFRGSGDGGDDQQRA